MAAKKLMIPENEDAELEEVSEKLDQMANDPLTFSVPKPTKKDTGPTVPVFLPEIPGTGDDVKVDQYEHVTIANELGERHWKIHRGEYVDVPVEVFAVLKARYPKL